MKTVRVGLIKDIIQVVSILLILMNIQVVSILLILMNRLHLRLEVNI